jgi:biofilm protein TabA
MIVTDLEHAMEQLVLSPSMKKAIEFLLQTRGKEWPDGRAEIDGKNVYAQVSSYESVIPDGVVKLEGHRNYIDIQYVASGEEVIGWISTDRLPVAVPYDPEKDAWFGTAPAGDLVRIRLSEGQLAVLYPSDAHAPKLASNKPTRIKKVVVKVAVS